MEYVYASLLLHSAKKPVTEDGITKILHAAGVTADAGRVKAIVSALEGVNIDEAISKAAMPMAAAPAATEGKKETKKEEKEEDVAKKSEDAAAGLSSLFG
jgi:large subunit ribosomal protein L12